MTKQRHASSKKINETPLREGRGAGVLMHITSLPSPFGTGDLGPEARKFAEFLHQSGQRYWQILPLSPTGEDQHYSPYSSASTMAGNPLLISPDLLVDDDLITPQDLKKFHVANNGTANFREASLVRDVLFEKGYRTFLSNSQKHGGFRDFCRKESYWLDDFALYTVLKALHEDKPWYEWPAPYRNRQQKALSDINRFHFDGVNKQKWMQYIFHAQWKSLKSYCSELNVQMVGDLPFYVSYDSTDVWAHPDIFKLDQRRNIKGVAGVPPDYFNSKGQLWGMPVFRWDVLKKRQYVWWVNRVRKNFELVDLLRLDHFRAFVAFWEVPAGEKTAVNGKWHRGPGAEFFKVLEEKLGKLQIIAEDLGDVDAAVYALRDEFQFPGMKVLQFAFGDNMTTSDYIPHNFTPNFVVYTGTHDNNTTVGWWLKDTGHEVRANLKQYVDEPGINQNNIHDVLGKMAFASVAKIVIIPLQDVLGLDESARMNRPASVKNNWVWRLRPGQLTNTARNKLFKWSRLYNRI